MDFDAQWIKIRVMTQGSAFWGSTRWPTTFGVQISSGVVHTSHVGAPFPPTPFFFFPPPFPSPFLRSRPSYCGWGSGKAL